MNRLALSLGPLLAACATSPPAHIGPVTAIAVAADGRIAACSQAGIGVGDDVHDWRRERPFACAFSAAGELLAAGGDIGRHGCLQLHDPDGTDRLYLQRGDDVFYAVAIATDGRVAAGNASGRVWLGELDDLTGIVEAATLRHTGPCRALAFSPDGATLATGGRDGRLLLHHKTTGATREVLDHTAGIECLCWLGDERLAAGARDGRVRLHDRSGRLLRTWQRLRGAVLALAACGDDLLIGLEDGRLLRVHPERDEPEVIAAWSSPIFALAMLDQHRVLVGQQAALRVQALPVR
ncbi:MAG: hypothetical protein IPK26_09405 [Planctomycetes bacterium]|nr:hypothetical protein [Planctomycetota bacterium]